MTSTNERRIALEGASNFRDLGGYETRDGRTTKWRHLYRSNALAGLTDDDVAALAQLGLQVVCDFRRDEERVEAPSRLPDEGGPKVVHFSIGPERENSRLYEELWSDAPSDEGIREAMKAIYRAYALEFTDHYSRFLDHVARTEHLPLLFHCAAGKDRTGFGAAVLLEALGVPRETIYADFDLTNDFLIRDMDRLAEKYPDMKSLEVFHTMLAANPDYLTAAYEVIDAQYGDIEAYLEQALNLTRAKRATIQDALLD